MKLFFMTVTLLYFPLIAKSDFEKINSLINRMLNEVKPNRVSLFVARTTFEKANVSYQCIVKSIKKRVPTLLIDANSPPSFLDFKNKSYNSNKKISAPLHFIIANGVKRMKMFSYIYKTVRAIRRSLYYLGTTKISVIVYADNGINEIIFQILKISHEFGFPTLKVLILGKKKSPIIGYWNYLNENAIITKNIKSDFIFFNDRISFFNGHKFKIGITQYYKNVKNDLNTKKDWMTFEINEKQTVTLIQLIDTFVRILNFTERYIVLNDNFQDSSTIIRKYNIDVFMMSCMYSSLSFVKSSCILQYTKILVIVPLKRKTHENISIINFFSIFTFLILISFFAIIVHIYKFPKNEWSLFNIYSLLLGIGTTIKLHNWRSKIVYIILIMVSFFLIPDIVSELTTFNLEEKQELLIESIDDIIKKNVAIQNIGNVAVTYFYDLTSLKNFEKFSNLSKINVIDTTVGLNNKILIIFDLEKEGRFYNLKLNPKNVKLLDFNLPIMFSTLQFRPASLYLDKFDLIRQRVEEFGFIKKWGSYFKTRYEFSEENDDDEDTILVYILATIILSGSCLALIAFVIEILIDYVKKNISYL